MSKSNQSAKTSTAAAPAASDAPRVARPASPARLAWRRLKADRGAIWSLRLLVVIGLLALLTPLLPLQSPRLAVTDRSLAAPVVSPLFIDYEALSASTQPEGADQSQASEIEPGFAADEIGWFDGPCFRARQTIFGSWRLNSLCGRDLLGRDVLSRIFWGARVSLAVGVVAALVSLLLGVFYGGIAGYVGGMLDAVMMRIVDVLQSVPFIFIVIFLVTALDARGGLLESWGLSRVSLFFFVVGSVFWLTMARVVRGQVRSLKQEPFVEAARAIGAGPGRILFRHILPHTRGVVLAYLTLTVPRVMLFEAFLSYLGLGISPPDVSWGLLLQEGVSVLTPIRIDWWLVAFPGGALSLTLFLLNVLGDGLRDAFDPQALPR